MEGRSPEAAGAGGRLRVRETLAGLGALLTLAGCSTEAPRARIPLVVLVTVDQLRADLLDRYDSLFTGGFRRLRDEGLRFTEARVDHAVTVSHPGHVTLATGKFPSHHGIVDAAFYAKEGDHRRLEDALADPNERILGEAGRPGVSPSRILATTLSEWFHAADPNSRAVALGSGQYASLLHAGRLRGDVYWYSPASGRYVTSSYYRADYPPWVERFNEGKLADLLASSDEWSCGVPAGARSLALSDDSTFEGDHVHVAFPHRLADFLPPGAPPDPARLRGARAAWLAWTPVLDEATLLLAREAVTSLGLGQRGSSDYLSIVVSQVDDIGHSYGPFSLEQLDNLMKLDRELGEFFDHLDRAVGRGRWLAALSADHGVADVPEHLLAEGGGARRVTSAEIDAVLAAAAKAASEGGEEGREDRVAKAVRSFDFVADAMTTADLSGPADGSDPFRNLYRRSWRPDRVPRFPLFALSGDGTGIGQYGVSVRLAEGAIIDLDPGVHGSPYDYDRRVPFVLLGPGVAPGPSDVPARTVDVAPTLASIAGIPFPDDLDGRPLAPAPGTPAR